MTTTTTTHRVIVSAYCDEPDCRWDGGHLHDEAVKATAERHAEGTGHRVGFFTQTTEFITRTAEAETVDLVAALRASVDAAKKRREAAARAKVEEAGQ